MSADLHVSMTSLGPQGVTLFVKVRARDHVALRLTPGAELPQLVLGVLAFVGCGDAGVDGATGLRSVASELFD